MQQHLETIPTSREKPEEACHGGDASWPDGALRRWAALASDQRHREDSGPIVSGRVCSISIGPKAESCGIYCLLFTAPGPWLTCRRNSPRDTVCPTQHTVVPCPPCYLDLGSPRRGVLEVCLDVSACLLSGNYPALRVRRDNGCT